MDKRPPPVFPVWPMLFPENVLTKPSESESPPMSVYAHLLVFGPLVVSVAFLGGLVVVTACDRMLHR